MRTHAHTSTRRRQSGAVLIVSLLFLVILTILGVTAMTGTTLEHRMAGNTRDYAIALQAAEAALRDAHRDVNPKPTERGRNTAVTSYGGGVPGTCGVDASATGNLGLCLAQPQIEGATGYVLPATMDIEVQPSVLYGRYTGAQPLSGIVAGAINTVLPKQPKYIVEAMCGIEPPTETVSSGVTCGFRRITARGYGVNPNTQVTLQEIYRIAVF
jgi:type IV pilus assembly protein PilX